MGDAKYKQRHKEQGLCKDCSRPALPMRSYCIIHGEKYNLRFKEWMKNPAHYKSHHETLKKIRQLYRDTNRCIVCSAPLGEQDEGYVTCMNCRDVTFKTIPKYSPIAGGLLENYYKEIAE